MMEVVSGDNWSYKSCKAAVESPPLTNNTQCFTGRMPFGSPNQQCQSTEGTTLPNYRYTKTVTPITSLVLPATLSTARQTG